MYVCNRNFHTIGMYGRYIYRYGRYGLIWYNKSSKRCILIWLSWFSWSHDWTATYQQTPTYAFCSVYYYLSPTRTWPSVFCAQLYLLVFGKIFNINSQAGRFGCSLFKQTVMKTCVVFIYFTSFFKIYLRRMLFFLFLKRRKSIMSDNLIKSFFLLSLVIKIRIVASTYSFILWFRNTCHVCYIKLAELVNCRFKYGISL